MFCSTVLHKCNNTFHNDKYGVKYYGPPSYTKFNKESRISVLRLPQRKYPRTKKYLNGHETMHLLIFRGYYQ